MREHYGPGLRIYFKLAGTRLLPLLAGSSKRDQDAIIAKTKTYMEDYERRRKRKP
jgi:putative addiction module killer protein